MADIATKNTDRIAEYKEKFINSTEAFDKLCSEIEHRRCNDCHIVSIQDIFKSNNICKRCAGKNAWTNADMLPLWIDEFGNDQFYVPEVLSCLREGEKLLIQQISVFVPLHHLKYGQLGTRGHIVSFPQDITEVCKKLPRTPENVKLIRVVKHFKLAEGEITSTSFMIRKKNVLDALQWLQKYNVHYADIEIVGENMDWIANGSEQQLPATLLQEEILTNAPRDTDEDRGPAAEQIAMVTDMAVDMEPCYGTLTEYNDHVPKVQDTPVVEAILNAQQDGMSENQRTKTQTMEFPYVSPDPVCEYTERHLFEKAFPCLFPGGTGGFGSIKDTKATLADWLKQTMLYEDCRFAKDRMWSFCALNFFARHTNQGSGAFFINSFYKQGPKCLEDLKQQIANNDYSWLSSITYFSHRVTGSSAYWRARRNEVFAWINYHLEKKNGPPSFFITFSCAEYHWKDIERLITDRCSKGGLNPPDFTTGRTALINEYTIVIQEYFQKRIEAWLMTVGKELLHIKHHWLRYEFAPSRGQIHVHMLAICDNMEMLRMCSQLKDNKKDLATYLASWMEDTLGMTANIDLRYVNEMTDKSQTDHPSTQNYSDLKEENPERDTARCQLKFQSHKCSAYCMRARKVTQKKETAEEKKRRVCRCGAGVERTYMKCDTPGFHQREIPELKRDIRGFDRVDLARNNTTITQASKYLMRGWRANCDIQLLIYKSMPDDVEPADISRVTNYVVSYACKGNDTVIDEMKAMRAIIDAAKEDEGDVREMRRLARQLLNQCSKNRVISKQEAVCQLAGLDLYNCSETLVPVSLSGNTKLGLGYQGRTFLASYATRDKKFHDMSLDKYFHFRHNTKQQNNKKDNKLKIPIYSGAQCEAVHPATPGYARAVMLIYSAWNTTFDLDKNEKDLMAAFHNFVSDPKICPESVSVSYKRAETTKTAKEPTASSNDMMDYGTFSIQPDQELQDLVNLASTIYSKYEENQDKIDMQYDYGDNYDWDKRTVEVSWD